MNLNSNVSRGYAPRSSRKNTRFSRIYPKSNMRSALLQRQWFIFLGTLIRRDTNRIEPSMEGRRKKDGKNSNINKINDCGAALRCSHSIECMYLYHARCSMLDAHVRACMSGLRAHGLMAHNLHDYSRFAKLSSLFCYTHTHIHTGIQTWYALSADCDYLPLPFVGDILSLCSACVCLILCLFFLSDSLVAWRFELYCPSIWMNCDCWGSAAFASTQCPFAQ